MKMCRLAAASPGGSPTAGKLALQFAHVIGVACLNAQLRARLIGCVARPVERDGSIASVFRLAQSPQTTLARC